MFRRKAYGQSKTDTCAFCGGIATQKNETGALVCRHHLQAKLEEIRCTCSAWLEQRSGKFGPYFHCRNCGNINFKKGLEMKNLMPAAPRASQPPNLPSRPQPETKRFVPREITISTKDVEYFD